MSTTVTEGRTVSAPPRAHTGPPRHPGTVAERTPGTIIRGAQAARPWVDGSLLLTNLHKWITRYLYLDSEAKAVALVLWVAGTHFRDEKGDLVHESYPIAGFLSDEPGSGKTLALEILSVLCPEADSILTEPSEAAVARLIGKHKATLLLDEADILFGSGRRKAAIRAMLNSGYKRGGIWARASKGDVEKVPTYGAKAVAALKSAKTGTGNDLIALWTRIVEWEMTKPPAGTTLRKLREVFEANGSDGRPHRVTGRDIGRHLAAQLTDWAAQERDALTGSVPPMPAGVELREEEKWLPLLAVAERAHVNREALSEQQQEERPDWRTLAWAACTDLSLYGGTPDTAPQYADAIGEIIDGWETPAPSAGEPDGWIADDQAEAGGFDEFAAPEPAPAGQFTAGYIQARGSRRVNCMFDGGFPTPEAAQEACEEDAGGGHLPWTEAEPGAWTATTYDSNGETTYIVSEK